MDISDINLDQVYSYMQNGIVKHAPAEINNYLTMMDKVRGMYLRKLEYGTKDIIINHLIKYEGLSLYLANKLYHQTLEYFYCSTSISNKAFSNMYADKLDNLAALAETLIKDAKDAKAVADIYVKARIARGLDKEEIPELPAELFERPFKLYGMDPGFIGLEEINRNALAKQIDDLDLTEKEKDRLKSDAAINEIKLFYDEQEDVYKQ